MILTATFEIVLGIMAIIMSLLVIALVVFCIAKVVDYNRYYNHLRNFRRRR